MDMAIRCCSTFKPLAPLFPEMETEAEQSNVTQVELHIIVSQHNA